MKELTIDTTSLPGRHLRLIESIVPPSLLVDRSGRVVHLSDGAKALLGVDDSAAAMGLGELLQTVAGVDVPADLTRAMHGRDAMVLRSLRLRGTRGAARVDLHVVPAPAERDGWLVVLSEPRQASGAEPSRRMPSDREDDVRRLETELAATRAHLQEITELYEHSTAALGESNEALSTINEELRSATEELEARREEMQANNEALSRSNAALEREAAGLALADCDLRNLMRALPVTAVFVDGRMLIMRFAAAAADALGLEPRDIGRPIGEVAARLGAADLELEASRVFAELAPARRELTGRDGRTYLMRATPYRSDDDRISGVVLVFVAKS